jgi:hypothetical protein
VASGLVTLAEVGDAEIDAFSYRAAEVGGKQFVARTVGCISAPL